MATKKVTAAEHAHLKLSLQLSNARSDGFAAATMKYADKASDTWWQGFRSACELIAAAAVLYMCFK